MENFVKEVNNISEIGKNNSNDKFRNIRSIVGNIVSKSPSIKILDPMSENGDIRFEVLITDMGMTFEDIINYQEDIFSDYMSNFLGEMIVRENINEFAKKIIEIDPNNYNEIVNKYDHRVFGMQMCKLKIIFSFHISLLQKILTEDFKKDIGRINEN